MDDVDAPPPHSKGPLKRLYDLQQDLDKNKADNDFCRQGGKILYFVDANVVVGFVTPGADAQSMSRDFGSFLRGRPGSAGPPKASVSGKDRPPDIRSILMMLTTEYVFGEELVGKGGDRLYVTPWHRDEIASNLVRIHATCMKHLISEGGRAACVEKQAKRISTILRKESEIAQRRMVPAASSEGKRTIGELIKKSIDQSDFLQLALEVANDMLSEPLDQIDRLLKEKLIHDDAATWGLTRKRILAGHQPWIGIAEYQDVEKTEIINDDDARSISFMQWLADHCMVENERLVFITQDVGLARWYDKWFNSDSRPGEYKPSHYIVRMLSQYLPQLNIKNARNTSSEIDSEESGKLFEEIRNNVEVILAADTLSSAREHGTRASRRDLVVDAMTKLAEIERESIYLFEHYLGKRVADDIRERLKSLSDTELAIEIKNHLFEKMEMQTRGSIYYFADRVSEVRAGDWSRVPGTLRFPLTTGKTLSGFIDDAIERGRIDPDLVNGLELHSVFAICSGIFLATNDRFRTRQHAIRYAELCLAECRSARNKDSSELLRESNFLCALVTRFMLGDASDINAAESHFAAAIGYLEDARSASVDRLADTIRIYAEHAATLLFMAAHDIATDRFDSGSRRVDEAEERLKNCRALMGGLYRGEDGVFPEIKRHYTHNLAAVHVLRSLSDPEYVVPDDEELVASVEKILEKCGDESKPSFYLLAELSFFLTLSGHSDSGRVKELFREFRESSAPVLRVDKWQFEVMCRYLGV